jgi:hypothetical protein
VKVLDLSVPVPTPWQQAQFGDEATNPEVAGWIADPDHDGIPNLLEYASNLLPLQATPSVLTRNTGTAGLPSVFITSTASGPVLTIQYLRLKPGADAAATSPGITYTPQFSSTLADENAWSPATGTETVQSIDATWERVTVTDTISPVPAARFGRVKVTLNP